MRPQVSRAWRAVRTLARKPAPLATTLAVAGVLTLWAASPSGALATRWPSIAWRPASATSIFYGGDGRPGSASTSAVATCRSPNSLLAAAGVLGHRGSPVLLARRDRSDGLARAVFVNARNGEMRRAPPRSPSNWPGRCSLEPPHPGSQGAGSRARGDARGPALEGAILELYLNRVYLSAGLYGSRRCRRGRSASTRAI